MSARTNAYRRNNVRSERPRGCNNNIQYPIVPSTAAIDCITFSRVRPESTRATISTCCAPARHDTRFHPTRRMFSNSKRADNIIALRSFISISHNEHSSAFDSSVSISFAFSTRNYSSNRTDVRRYFGGFKNVSSLRHSLLIPPPKKMVVNTPSKIVVRKLALTRTCTADGHPKTAR